MAGKAIGWRTGKISPRMATGAIFDFMSPGKREESVVDIIGRPIEAIHPVALLTIDRKGGVIVVGVGGGVEIIQVAIDAVIADPVKLQGRFRYVAIIATQHCMCPQQGKSIFLMQFRNIVHQPVRRRMTAGAVCPNSSAVHIRVAGNALGTRFLKNQGLMAIPAIHLGVLPLKRKSGKAVVERKGVHVNFPTERRVAVGTVGFEATAVWGLRKEAGCQP